MSDFQADYINPFIDATTQTFDTMLSVRVRKDAVYLKGQGPDITGVSGIIGLGGQATGVVALNFSSTVAVKAVEAFIGEEIGQVSGDVVDGVGELTNIIAGNAKHRLATFGYRFDIGLPKIVKGQAYETKERTGSVPCIVIRFASPFGPLSLEVSLGKDLSGVSQRQSEVAPDMSKLDVLDQTLKGSISLLTDLISLANFNVYGRVNRVQQLVRSIVDVLDLPDPWRFETGTMLAQVGCMILPADLIARVRSGRKLDAKDRELFNRHPQIGAKLLLNIPGLEDTAYIVEHHLHDHRDYSAVEVNRDIALGAQALRLALVLDGLLCDGWTQKEAISHLREKEGIFNPDLLDIAETLDLGIGKSNRQYKRLVELSVGDVLDENLLTVGGSVLVGKGQAVSEAMLQRIRFVCERTEVYEPFAVLV